VGSSLLADVLETMRLGMTPLVNAWKLPIKNNEAAADDSDVAAYLGLCSQVCEAVSSFIVSTSSAAASSTKKGGAAPAASHARAVLKLQVTRIFYARRYHNVYKCDHVCDFNFALTRSNHIIFVCRRNASVLSC
jgi:hypothetical protein